MKYSPEYYLKIARQAEKQANAEKDEAKKANLKEAARRHRIVAKVGWKIAAEKITTEMLDRLQKAASGR